MGNNCAPEATCTSTSSVSEHDASSHVSTLPSQDSTAIYFFVQIANLRLHLRAQLKIRQLRCQIYFDSKKYLTKPMKEATARSLFGTTEAQSFKSTSSEQRPQNIIEWPEELMEFLYEISDLTDLQDKALRIDVLDTTNPQQHRVIGTCFLELLEVCTGPIRCERSILKLPAAVYDQPLSKILDLQAKLVSKQQNVGRLSFDCRMDVIREWKMDVTRVEIELTKEESTAEWITAAFRNDRQFILSYAYDRQQQPDQAHFRRYWSNHEPKPVSQLRLQKAFVVDIPKPESRLIWNQDELVPIQDTGSFQDLQDGSLRIQLKRVNVLEDGKVTEDPTSNPAYRLYGECWIPCAKIISTAQQPLFGANTSTSTISCPLWIRGVVSGKLKISFSYGKLPETTQMFSGVNTDEGIMSVSPLVEHIEEKMQQTNLFSRIFHPKQTSTKLPGELRKLIKKFSELQGLLSRIHEERDILPLCNSMLMLLRTTTRENMLSFTYDTDEALKLGREFFMNLSTLLLEFLDMVRHQIKCMFFVMLFSTIKRSELSDPRQFKLAGAADFVRSTRSNAKMRSLIDSFHVFSEDEVEDDDIEMALKYRHLLFSLHAYAVKKLNVKASFDELRIFCARILVVSFFRLPQIQSKLSNAILPQAEVENEHWRRSILTLTPNKKHFQIPEWSNTRFDINRPDPEQVFWENCLSSVDYENDLNPRFSRPDQLDPVLELLNWQHFHTGLESHVDCMELLSQEEQVPTGVLWLERLKKHGHFFFLFAEEYMRHVLDTLVLWKEGSIRWELIPGYIAILKAFLLELKSWPIEKYPESMVKLSRTMVANENLLSTMMKIILFRTNIHSLKRISFTLFLLRKWIRQVGKFYKQTALWNFPMRHLNAGLPPDFDMGIVCYAVDQLLGSEQNQIVLNTLLFLYKTWDSFPEAGTDQLTQVLRKHVFRLFSHWSEITRKFFHHLLIFHVLKSVSFKAESIELTPVDGIENNHTRYILACLKMLSYSRQNDFTWVECFQDPSNTAMQPASQPKDIAASIKHDHRGVWDVQGKSSSPTYETLMKHISTEFTIPSYQLIYVSRSIVEFEELLLERYKQRQHPKLTWQTVVLEDIKSEKLDKNS